MSTETWRVSSQKLVFHYEYVPFGEFHKLAGVYPLIAETKTHLQIKRWYGKRWYPKNDYWRIEEL